MSRRDTKSRNTMRLARYIAQAGVAARRKAETLIREGHVKVNGKLVTDVATNVVSGKDNVSVKGAAVVPEPLFYALLNKPKGCITAVSDPWDRPTVMDYLPKLPARVKPVGRLDFYSEGVLLLTNDGELASALLKPKGRVEKTYHVKVRGTVSDRQIDLLRAGVRIGPRTTTREAQVDRLKTQSKHDWLVITLTEGKSRQIHRMIEAIDLTVTKLQRVAFAGLNFHGLRVGDARELTQTEVNELRMLTGLKRDSNAVGRGVWSARREDSELGRRARARARAEREAEEDQSGEARPARPGARDEAKPARGKAKPARGKTEAGDKAKPARGKAKPARGKAKPARGKAKPARGKASAPARGKGKPGARGAARPGARGAAKSGAKAKSAAARGPARGKAKSGAKAKSASARGPARGRGKPKSGAKTKPTSSRRARGSAPGKPTGGKGRSSKPRAAGRGKAGAKGKRPSRR